MRDRLKKICRKLFLFWILWGIVNTGCGMIKSRIPVIMHLYEDEAIEVISGGQKKLTPEELNLDFAGSVDIKEAANGTYEAVCNLFGIFPITTMQVEVISRQELIPGGIPVGIYVETDGIFVIGTGSVETKEGLMESPGKNIVKTGDYIIGFQGENITQKQELIEKLENFEGEEIILDIRRNGEELQVSIDPVFDGENYRIGVWVRDDTQGVGTLTFLSADQKFGALGHGISDSDSELLMEVSEGRIYDCSIIGITKGQVGNPGKLSGKINYSRGHLYGTILENSKGGIYGEANMHLQRSVQQDAMPIALRQEVKEGKASILSSVDGNLCEYAVEIQKIYRGETEVYRGMEIKVTDEKLLELTGGIVQGMSGSPIIQDGKIVGAVTHVLVNDPTKGYGIFIENMLEH